MRYVARGVIQLPIGANAYLVDGDEGVTLVDTGVPGKVDVIESGLKKMGRTWSDLKAVLITHAHPDHTGSARAVKDASQAPVTMSARDARVPHGLEPVTPPPLKDAIGPLGGAFRFLPKAEGFSVATELAADGTDGLPAEWSVINTPGHTPGHVSYLLDRAGGLLFAGDAAMVNRSGQVYAGLMNPKSEQVKRSIVELAQHDFRAAYFGHGGQITNDAASAFRRFAYQQQ
ncbi:MBL fold metallo-hydrolase [Ornithinimicrobium sp. Arc0846-15]|nr:MBL fold metallo-hydrolase [Ornithinimicrobium laminariae]